MPAHEFSDSNFDQEVLKSNQPVLVDFWAEWCAPCKMQGPIIDDMAKEYVGKAKIGSMEVDQNPQYPQQYGIMSIPTLILFKGGKPVWQSTGLTEKERLAEALDKVLG
ncbi:MAG: thioredoxin [Parcubacteria group bacterium]